MRMGGSVPSVKIARRTRRDNSGFVLIMIKAMMVILPLIILYLALNEQADDVMASIMPDQKVEQEVEKEPEVKTKAIEKEVIEKIEESNSGAAGLKKKLFAIAKRKEVSLDSKAVTTQISRQYNQSSSDTITKKDGTKYYIYGEVSYYIPRQCDKFASLTEERSVKQNAALFGRFANQAIHNDLSIFDNVMGFTPKHMQNLESADEHEEQFAKIESKIINGYSDHLDFNEDLTQKVISIYNRTVIDKTCKIDESNLRLNVYVGARGGLPSGIINQKRL